MPRAHRHYIPGYVWHITHRCHQKEFLLKFSQDRKRYVQWLYEAKKRYGLSVLNYIVTSNHIHLMVVDTGKDIISKSMQLVAGRVGQEYNQKKDRKGAFWEDRYHATIVQTNRHLMSCMVYIDLNMVRAGAVSHPSEWDICGYNEILHEPVRYKIIDREALKNLLGFTDEVALIEAYGQAISPLQMESKGRQPMWTESIAVGDKDSVVEAKRKLSSLALGRKVVPKSDAYILREPSLPYKAHVDSKDDVLRLENAYLWDIYSDKSKC